MTIGLHKDAQIKVKCQKTMYQARCFHQVLQWYAERAQQGQSRNRGVNYWVAFDSTPPAFDFLPRNASRRVFISVIFFPIEQ